VDASHKLGAAIEQAVHEAEQEAAQAVEQVAEQVAKPKNYVTVTATENEKGLQAVTP